MTFYIFSVLFSLEIFYNVIIYHDAHGQSICNQNIIFMTYILYLMTGIEFRALYVLRNCSDTDVHL